MGYRGLQEVKRDNKRLHGVRSGLQGVTGGDKGLKEVTGG